MIRDLTHVCVFITDIDRSLSFYRDKLGFEVRNDWVWGEGYRWVTVGPVGASVEIILHQADEEETAKIGKWTGHIFATDDIQKTYSELRAKGVHFTESPREMVWGGTQGQFADPDGNRFELLQTRKDK